MDSGCDNELPSDGGMVPVSRHTLHAELVERIRDMIISDELPPGAKVNEVVLCGKLGVSRTPLREAIKFIASEGLVELVPGRGAVVRRLSKQDVREMLEFLSAIESMAARTACRTATKTQIRDVRRMHQRMMRFYAQRDRLNYYKIDQSIHSAIVDLGGNAFASAHHEATQSRLKRIRFMGNESPETWDAAVAEHQAMIAALEARDGDWLAMVITAHMERTWDRIEAGF